MHGAEFLHGGVRQSLDVLRFGDVSFDGNHVTQRGKAIDGLLHLSLIDVGDDDLHPFFQEAFGQAQADAGCAARDHGNAAP